MPLWDKIKAKTQKIKDNSIKTWGSVKEKAVEVTKKVAKKVEDTAEKVVEWANKIKNDKAQLSNRLSEESPYKPNNSNSVNDFATIVSRYIKETGPIFDEFENQFIEIYSEQLIGLLDLLNLGADKEIIKMTIEDGKKSLKDTMKKHLNKRVNISDYKFISIIEMPKGILKNEKLNTFIYEVLIESRDLFCEKLREVLKNDHDFILNHFKNKNELLKNAINASLNDLQNAEMLASKDENIKKEEILKSSIVMCQCEYVINKV